MRDTFKLVSRGIERLFNKNLNTFFLYFIFFILFFISFPLQESLISQGDAWYYVASYNAYLNDITDWFLGQNSGQFLYPDQYPYLNGEPGFGMFPIWLLFKLITHSDVWSYYFLVVFIYSLNSYSAYLLFRSLEISTHYWAAICAGILFCLNMFMFANIDNINTIFFAPGIFSILFFYKSIKNFKIRDIYFFSFFLIWMLLSSAYNFIYSSIFIFAIILVKHKSFYKSVKASYTPWIVSFSFGVLICISYLYLVLFFKDKANHYTWNESLLSIKYASITIDDFFRVLPDTLYSSNEPTYFFFEYQSLFWGFIFTLAVLIGLFLNKLKHIELYLTLSIGLLLGFGVYITVNGQNVLLPLGHLFEYLQTYTLFRFPWRIFLLITLIAAFFVSKSFSFLAKRYEYGALLISILTILVIIENTPFKRKYFNFNKIEKEALYLKKVIPEDCSTVLFLPFEDFIIGGYNDYRPSFRFMYFQSIIKKNVVNGFSAYSPPHHVAINQYLNQKIKNYPAFIKLVDEIEVCAIVDYSEKWDLASPSSELILKEEIQNMQTIQLIQR